MTFLPVDSEELLVEGDVAVQLQRNAVSCFFCKWKKSDNGLVEVPMTISPDFCKCISSRFTKFIDEAVVCHSCVVNTTRSPGLTDFEMLPTAN